MTNRSQRQNSRVLRRFIAIPLVLLTALLISYAVRSGLANAAYFQAQFHLEHWDKVPGSVQQNDYEDAFLAAERALSLLPDHPHYQLAKAKVMEWGWFAGFVSTQQMQAVDRIYQQAISARPHWPNAYADYAWYLSTVEGQLPAALEQLKLALQFGPYSQDVMHRYMVVHLSQWPQLDPQAKADALSMMSRSLQSPLQAKIIELISSYQLARISCIYLKRQPLSTEQLQRQVLVKLCS